LTFSENVGIITLIKWRIVMGAMKTLAIAMEDGVLDNPELDDVRREG